MPRFAHLPLLLKPVGDGKLSKRDGEALGFPVFPLSWMDVNRNVEIPGFREKGYLPEALLNFLALLGWNPGTEQELFSLKELVEVFSLERIGKSGTRFDIQKANWFNHHYLQQKPVLWFREALESVTGRVLSDEELTLWVQLVRERCSFPQEMNMMVAELLKVPAEFDPVLVKEKWNTDASTGLRTFLQQLDEVKEWNAASIKEGFSRIAENAGLKPGKLFLPLRIAMTGSTAGPDLMLLMELLGKENCANRISGSLSRIEALI
jgi:glutamyl-tRNA synthetase